MPDGERKDSIIFANIRLILKFERGHLEQERFMRLGWVRTGSASNCLACSGFQTKLLGSLLSYAHTVSSKNVVESLLSDDTSFMGLFSLGFPEKGTSNRRSVFTALTHAVRCSLMSRIY